MAKSNYSTDMYRQIEEMMIKIDTLLAEINHLKLDLKFEQEENKKKDKKNFELMNKLTEALKKIEELQNELDKEKSKNNKNSGNSSKPPSTDITKPKKKKTGANTYNYRTKSGKKCGGQYFHEGKTYTKERLEKEIKDQHLKVVEIEHYIKGNNKKAPLVKYKIGIQTEVIVYKHIFKYSKKSTDVLPKEYYTDVTYDNSIKALSINLNTINVVSLDRQTEFFSAITNGFLNIKKGTLTNFKREFSNKAQESLLNLEKNLLSKAQINTDESTTKKDGKQIYVRNYSNKETVLYKIHEHKGHAPIKEDNILTRFLGGIMGDHDTTLYSYGSANYECNIHTGRYLKEIIELAPDITWAERMLNLLFMMNRTRKIALAFGCKSFTYEKINEYISEYDNILEIAKEEDRTIKSKTFKDKAEKLRRRLLKYKNNQLAFIKDFSIDFDNNMSESDIRVFKIKTKVSGGFRSMSDAQVYADSLSIVKTSKKRKINPMKVIEFIFKNKILFG